MFLLWQGYLNSRYTITVGAVGKNSLHASYSSTGPAALFVSGPGGDVEFASNHMTAEVGGGCTDAYIGTSYAAPAVSGGIALMLEKRPALTWRDVQGILAKTSRKVELSDPDWTTNSAGFSHNPKYGFGIMDVYNAVQEAETWELWGDEQSETKASGTIDLEIPDDDPEGVTSTITMDGFFPFTESVVVKLNVVRQIMMLVGWSLVCRSSGVSDLFSRRNFPLNRITLQGVTSGLS